MSLLMNVIRTAMATRKQQPGAEAEAGGSLPHDARLAGPAPAGEPPAWRLLDAQTGVQDLSYGEHARPGVKELFRHSPRRVLDIGCATGAVAADLKRSVPGLWAWGCELNAQAAQVAAGRLDHVSTVPREQWSAADLALVETVDTVLLLDVLEHMYNPWAELAFLAQRLPRDAQVVVSLPNVGHLSVLQNLADGAFPYQALGILDVTHVRFFTYDGMQAMFEETGFEVEAVKVLARSPATAVRSFPIRLALRKMTLDVDSEEEWERLHAIQFGFRLRPRKDGSLG